MTNMSIKGRATIDDLLRTPKDGRKYELVDGEIVVSPAGMRHSEIGVNIARIIANYLDDHPIGKVYSADVGIVLPNGNIRSPDVTFVKLDKLPDGQSPDTFGYLVPDFAVEVLSPSDSMRQVGQKIGEYLEVGVELVWLADPSTRSVTAYRSLTAIRHYSSPENIDAEPLLPGFSAPVERFF